jgi:hypothetical protein
METTKQYIAIDSMIARPTNNVRVMVAEASGCCARDANAVATAFPSPNAGPITPTLIVKPAVMIDTIAIRLTLSIISPSLFLFYPAAQLLSPAAASSITCSEATTSSCYVNLYFLQLQAYWIQSSRLVAAAM